MNGHDCSLRSFLGLGVAVFGIVFLFVLSCFRSLGAFGYFLGPCGAHLERPDSWVLFGSSWVLLGSSWVLLGSSWVLLGSSLGVLWECLGALECSVGVLGHSLELLGRSWVLLGRSWKFILKCALSMSVGSRFSLWECCKNTLEKNTYPQDCTK